MASEGIDNPPDSQIESNWDQTTESFDDMELKPELLRGIYAYGYGNHLTNLQRTNPTLIPHLSI
ncbi:translation initiation factor eIF4A, variant 2 [Orbilia oligospora]|nr:translation initiation factor eIF4A, variant 2 [Orbilia oligospora]